jgi:hypothetical protein
MKYFFVVLTICGCIACKKTYTCECYFKNVQTDHTLPNETLKQATSACNDFKASWQDQDGSCTLLK